MIESTGDLLTAFYAAITAVEDKKAAIIEVEKRIIDGETGNEEIVTITIHRDNVTFVHHLDD